MKTSVPKIGKIKLKSGGAEIHVIDGPEQTNPVRALQQALNTCREEDIVACGYFLVCASGEVISGWGSSAVHRSILVGGAAVLQSELSELYHTPLTTPPPGA